jgi:hypothetical protein
MPKGKTADVVLACIRKKQSILFIALFLNLLFFIYIAFIQNKLPLNSSKTLKGERINIKHQPGKLQEVQARTTSAVFPFGMLMFTSYSDFSGLVVPMGSDRYPTALITAKNVHA